MTHSNKSLKIANIMISHFVNGPGKRCVIWFQGCPIRCAGCFNKELWDEEGGKLISAQELFSMISSFKDIEGITLTGGEPLAQARNLLSLLKMVKSAGLTVICYSGYLLENILDNKIANAKDCLEYIDVLIDGPFLRAEKSSLIWRGSKNQKIHFLTEKYKHLKPLVNIQTSEIEIIIYNDQLFLTGIIDNNFWKNLKDKIEYA